MMAISANGIGRADVQRAQSSSKTREEKKESDVFASLINIGTAQTQDVQSGNGSDELVQETDFVKNEYVPKDRYESSVPDKADSVKENACEDSFGEADEPRASRISRILGELRDSIKAGLEVDDEELDALLEQLGITLNALLDVTKLKGFLLQVQDASEVDMLIDEKLAKLVSDITAALESAFEENGLTDASGLIPESESVQETELVNPNEDIMLTESDAIPPKVNNGALAETADEAKDTEEVSGREVINTDKNTDTITDGETLHTGADSKDLAGQDRQSQGSQILTNLNQAIEQAVSAKNVDGISYSDSVQEADIIRQIIDEIRVYASKDSSSIEMQLNPENLGKVQISVINRNGAMQAQIIAETEAAKRAIESNISALKEAFNNQELKVDAVEVMVAAHEFFSHNQENNFSEEQQKKNTGRTSALSLNEIADENELSDEEQLELTMMKTRGNSVSYSV